MIKKILNWSKPKQKPVIERDEEDEMFMQNDPDEFSPENIDFEKAIKTATLRNKLRRIEKELYETEKKKTEKQK
jgi:phosphomevalonate kinase